MGNRIQSCALSAVQDSNAQVEFVNCFMVLFKKGHLNEEYGQTVSINLEFVSSIKWFQFAVCFKNRFRLGLCVRLL